MPARAHLGDAEGRTGCRAECAQIDRAFAGGMHFDEPRAFNLDPKDTPARKDIPDRRGAGVEREQPSGPQGVPEPGATLSRCLGRRRPS